MSKDFDSDSEEQIFAKCAPLDIDWFSSNGTLETIAFADRFGICSLPGKVDKRHKTARDMQEDLALMTSMGVTDVFFFNTDGELRKFQVPELAQKYAEAGITPHHFPVCDGLPPTAEQIWSLWCEFKECMAKPSTKALMHCLGGLGRAGTVAACMILESDVSITPQQAVDAVRSLRGPRAIQTVKQSNFIEDWRTLKLSLPQAGTSSNLHVS